MQLLILTRYGKARAGCICVAFPLSQPGVSTQRSFRPKLVNERLRPVGPPYKYFEWELLRQLTGFEHQNIGLSLTANNYVEHFRKGLSVSQGFYQAAHLPARSTYKLGVAVFPGP